MGNDDQQAKQQQPRLVSRANLEWEATRTPKAPGRRAQGHRCVPASPGKSGGLGPVHCASPSSERLPAASSPRSSGHSLYPTRHPFWPLPVPAPWWAAYSVGTQMTARFEYDPATRDLRHQARQETRVAAGLQALESAGWVLHDRLVAAHRVPHVLVGPPRVVLVYPYYAGVHPTLRYQLRRTRACAHSLLAFTLALPLVVLRARPLPHLSAAPPVTQI